MIREAKLVKEAEAKNQQMWAEKSPPLQEQKVQLPTYGLRKKWPLCPFEGNTKETRKVVI